MKKQQDAIVGLLKEKSTQNHSNTIYNASVDHFVVFLFYSFILILPEAWQDLALCEEISSPPMV